MIDKLCQVIFICACVAAIAIAASAVNYWINSGKSVDDQLAEMLHKVMDIHAEIINKQSSSHSDFFIFAVVLAGIVGAIVFFGMVLRHRENMAQMSQNQQQNQFRESVHAVGYRHCHEEIPYTGDWEQFNHTWGGER